MPNNILLLCRLMRLHAPIGYLLVFFPAFWGQALSSDVLDYHLTILLVIGSIFTRSAGCIINDIFDQDLDRQVHRTKDRPLANGSISIRTALLLLIILSILSLMILLSLNKTAIIIGFIAFIMIVIYPLMKRITYLPQAFLGLTFNLGSLIAYAAVNNEITLPAILLYLSTCFWTLGYDTIYGYMDIEDDKKAARKSTSILFEHRNPHRWLLVFYTLFIWLFASALLIKGGVIKPINFIIILIAYYLLIQQVSTAVLNNPADCLDKFKSNGKIGAILCLIFFI